jgi:hypothetical protein
MRTIQRGLRLTKQEAADLDAVAESYGLDWPSCVRMLVKVEAKKLRTDASDSKRSVAR